MKRSLVIIFFVFCMLLVGMFTAQAAFLKPLVIKDGEVQQLQVGDVLDDYNPSPSIVDHGDGSISRSIEWCMNQLPNGGNVHLRPGTYLLGTGADGDIDVPYSNITLTGVPGASVIKVQLGHSATEMITIDGVDNFMIEGIKLDGSAETTNDFKGIRYNVEATVGKSSFIVNKCHITYTTNDCILTNNRGHISITDNILAWSKFKGIHLSSHCNRAKIIGNTFENNQDCGLYFCATIHYVSIVGNTFRGCQHGIKGIDSGVYNYGDRYVAISGNTFCNNYRYDLGLSGGVNTVIDGNIFGMVDYTGSVWDSDYGDWQYGANPATSDAGKIGILVGVDDTTIYDNNGDPDDSAAWTKVDCTMVRTVDAGNGATWDNNYYTITEAGAATQRINMNCTGLTAAQPYRFAIHIKDGTGTGISGTISHYRYNLLVQEAEKSFVTTPEWTRHEVRFYAIQHNDQIVIDLELPNASGQTVKIDDLYVSNAVRTRGVCITNNVIGQCPQNKIAGDWGYVQGIRVTNAEGLIIKGNSIGIGGHNAIFDGHGHGIYLVDRCRDIRVEGNTIETWLNTGIFIGDSVWNQGIKIVGNIARSVSYKTQTYDAKPNVQQETGIEIEGSNVHSAEIKDNIVKFNTVAAIDDNGTGTVIRGNDGFKTEASGTATIPDDSTIVDVSHGLDITPSIESISVTPTNNLGDASEFWISDVGANTFRVNIDVDPNGDANFAWQIN